MVDFYCQRILSIIWGIYALYIGITDRYYRLLSETDIRNNIIIRIYVYKPDIIPVLIKILHSVYNITFCNIQTSKCNVI